jgi:hypothetical protein
MLIAPGGRVAGLGTRLRKLTAAGADPGVGVNEATASTLVAAVELMARQLAVTIGATSNRAKHALFRTGTAAPQKGCGSIPSLGTRSVEVVTKDDQDVTSA